MIPILYAPDEQDFTSNGLGRLADCRKFEVTEERNGIYECEFEYPVTGPLFSELKYGYYVYATHDESKTPQAFEIYSREATLDGWATFRAWHISYQLNDVIVRPFTASGIADAMSKIPANEITPGPFTFWTDKTTAGDFKLDVPKAARALLGGSQGSLLDVFGKGDYEFDMHAVKLHIDRGADRGVSIRYGKNLKSLDQKLEGGDIVNGVVPFWQSTDGETVWLDFPIYGGAIAYPVQLITDGGETIQTDGGEDILAQWANAKVQALDLSSEFEEPPTQAQLADRARAIMASATSYQLEENLGIDFVALWQTEEYKSVAALQRVFLCDTVNIFYEKLGITASAKVIKTVYDTLRERYSSIELGEPKTTLAQQIQKTVSDGVMEEARQTFTDKTAMQTAIAYATALIQGGMGGHVVIKPDANDYPEEILIMDTPDKATAVNVWRWNLNGLGHSSTGYNGPFTDIALTADGKINADLITAGTLNADIIQAGTLSGITISGNTISGNTISGGTINGTNITGSTLLSTSANGSVEVKNGNINIYANSDGSGVPFATIKHVYDSVLGVDALQIENSGYTKLINTGSSGGQWTADFIQFALNPSNPQQMLQVYPDSDGYHVKFLTDFVNINGKIQGDLSLLGALDGGKVRKTIRVSSGKSLTIKFESNVFTCLLSATGYYAGGFGYLSYLSGYVTGSRLSNTVIKNESSIVVDTTATDNTFKVTNNTTVDVTFTFLVLIGQIIDYWIL